MIIEIILALLIGYDCFIIGNFILKLFNLKIKFGEEFVFSFGLGFGILAYIVLFFGLLGFLYKSVFLIVLLAVLLISIPKLISIIKNNKFKLKFSWFLIPIFLFLLLNLIGSLAPPTGWDTQIYHLPMAKVYSQTHKISYIPLIHTDLPALGDMMTTLGMLLYNDVTGTMIFYLAFLVLVYSIYLFSKKYFNKKIAYLSTIVFLSIPLVVYYASTNYTDMIVSLFAFLAVFAFIIWLESKENKWLVLASIFAGLSFSTKITAALVILAFLFLFLWKFMFTKERKKYFVAAVIFCFIVFLLTEIWFIKAYAFTGNPVYPVAYSIFGGPQNLTYLTEYTNLQLATGGYGRSILAYFLAPIQMTLNGYKFLTSFAITPLFLAFIPLLFFIRKSKIINILLIFSLGFFTFWFIIHPYLVKLIPLLSILSIITSYSIINATKEKKVFRFVLIFAVFAILFSLAMSGLIYKNQVKATLGLESRDSYLSKNLQIFDTYNYANENLNKSNKILMIGEARYYYLNIPFQEGDPARQGVIDYRIIDNSEFEKWLEANKITYILVNRDYFTNISDNFLNLYGYTEYSYSLINDFIENKAEQVYEKNNVFLYKI